jgi:transposase
LIDGIRFRVRTGVPWRDVPVEYRPWGRIYDLFRRWQRDGTGHRILTRLQSLAEAEGATTWDLSVDSTVCRAHQHAAGARKEGDLPFTGADRHFDARTTDVEARRSDDLHHLEPGRVVS